ncbi:MAG TPA: hypothetical protein ACFYD7_05440 [Candidatus Wujingus californicus]|uniref:hypothetical protein n=1 Tax=Candidatus Wujingus californicus TaxID=3367618 RepID=UPI001D5A1C66|nr:hypothetical protein [Planctomycetota bacterium]MDO8130869.1 hypothetical protein [Candidatus Brocadiales bacterium]
MNNDEVSKFDRDQLRKLGIFHSKVRQYEGKAPDLSVKENVFHEGEQAFFYGLELSDNYYTKTNNELALIWEIGWKEASEASKPFGKKVCYNCRKENQTKYSRWLCSYCGSINEPGDKIERIRKEINIYPIGRWITTVILFIGFLICFIAYFGFWQGVLIGGFISSLIAWIAGFLWPFVAVIIIGIIGIAYFIYKSS